MGACLQRVISGEADGEAAGEEGGKGVAVVVQEEGVIGERGHAQPDLSQVVQVLQGWGLAQVDAVGDVVTQQHGRHQVVYIPCLSCMAQTSRTHSYAGVDLKMGLALL